jgi:hypothetical protein
MRILILSICSDSKIYNKMIQLQKLYINSNKDVDVYFIKFGEQNEEIIVKDNIISIKGEESAMNIINKTIISLEYLINIEKKKYDYIVRTNISTIINIKNLIEYLHTAPINNFYSGGIYMKLNWLDYEYGINEETIEKYNLNNLLYVQGTSIILSFDVVQKIICYKKSINTDIIDDVSIAVFIRDLLPDAYNNISIYTAKYCINNYIDDCVFIRNKLFTSENYERVMDIERMKNIINTYLIVN